jgi:CRP-like cAMP-binding protein
MPVTVRSRTLVLPASLVVILWSHATTLAATIYTIPGGVLAGLGRLVLPDKFDLTRHDGRWIALLGQPRYPAMSQNRARISAEGANQIYVIKNRILATLPPDDLLALKPNLRLVEIKARAVLQEAHRRIEYVHFIERGIVSRVSGGRDCSIETAMVGCFGCTGVAIALGSNISTQRTVVRLAGIAWRIRADLLVGLMEERPQIRASILKYVQSLITQNTQGVLCAAKHNVGQRLARWLLLASDRTQGDVLAVTHDLLAKVLGVRRAGITEALLQLEAGGILKKMRGAVQLVDRSGLECRACDCYRIVRDAYAWPEALRCDEPVPAPGHPQAIHSSAATISTA